MDQMHGQGKITHYEGTAYTGTWREGKKLDEDPNNNFQLPNHHQSYARNENYYPEQ